MNMTPQDKKIAEEIEQKLLIYFSNNSILDNEAVDEIVTEQVGLMMDEIKFCISVAEKDQVESDEDGEEDVE